MARRTWNMLGKRITEEHQCPYCGEKVPVEYARPSQARNARTEAKRRHRIECKAPRRRGR